MPPKTSTASVKDLFLWTLLLPLVAALQQQPEPNHYAAKAHHEDLSEHAATAAPRWAAPAGDSLNTAVTDLRKYHDTHSDNQHQRPRPNNNERALATLVPSADSNAALHAPPALRSSSTAGLSSRLHQARSLQEWQVEDIILLATVDGRIHARDRNTGAEKWQLATLNPMVQTTYHTHNRSVDESGVEQEDPLWIIEPNQDGSIYLYIPSSGYGIQRLGFTVKELADRSPLAGEGHVYTADKKTTVYDVDAATGNILKTFSSMGSQANDSQSCRKVNPLDALEDEECEPMGTLTLGRTEYTIAVQDRSTSEQISTIRYSEWGPNNHDLDLRLQHNKAMDNKYVYTSHDGAILGFDLARSDSNKPTSADKPIFSHRLGSPVARIFDIVRREGDLARDASLVALPQPVAPSPDDRPGSADDSNERIFVDYTQDGSWYALSESNYPTVTWRAELALRNVDDMFQTAPHEWPTLSKRERDDFAGVHELYRIPDAYGDHLIDPPTPPAVDPPLAEEDLVKGLIDPPPSLLRNLPSLRNLFAVVVLGLVALGVLYRQQQSQQSKSVHFTEQPQPVVVEAELQIPEQLAEETTLPVRQAEAAQETIFPHAADNKSEEPAEFKDAEEEFEKIESNELDGVDEARIEEEPKPAKKKATRGKRGGKKQKEKEQQALAKRANLEPEQATEIVTVAASETAKVFGPLQINSLLIHTDKVIGQGSCGTSVFEGSFEGRDVAVKRMLSQYYELASQEVSFLQQSDDHPNVIRYFCQQKDDHFLYIAVELCQASLFEVWEAEKARTEERQSQLRTLKLTIQQDVPKALQQLAAGLYHLHNLRIIHRDIKPQNILVAFPKRNQMGGPRLVISDFGLGKNLPENVSTLIDPTGNAGTSGWKAPELISQPRESEGRQSQNHSHTGGSEQANGVTSGVKRAADIFSLGCLFFWVLTDGIHPYEDENGWQQLRELNIKRDNKKMEVLERWSDAYEPMQLITSMLEHQPERRPTALQVLNHPFFWPAEKRLFFLCDMSDHFEREPRGVADDGYLGDSDDLHLLECRSEEVIGAPFDRADFLAKLDRHFVDTLGKQRKYSGNRLLDLLRALRNKKHHYEDMPEEVKKRVGPLAGGYLGFWCNRFPRLLMACYEVVHECGLQNNDRFKGYFALGRM